MKLWEICGFLAVRGIESEHRFTFWITNYIGRVILLMSQKSCHVEKDVFLFFVLVLYCE